MRFANFWQNNNVLMKKKEEEEAVLSNYYNEMKLIVSGMVN